MAGGRTRRTDDQDGGKSKSGTSKKQSSSKSSKDQEKENLKIQLARMQKKLKLSSGRAKSVSKPGNMTAMEREVTKTTKNALWKVCKFIKNETKLDKAATFVMKNLELQELEGLEGTELAEAEETWKATYRSDIRVALNNQRNYVQQEVRAVVVALFETNQEDKVPNVEEMAELVMRDKLDNKTEDAELERYQKLFDFYWNELMPKVAGHSYWGPAKRHHVLLSSGKKEPDDPECETYVTASDEAFLLVLWENCFKKWQYSCLEKRKDAAKDVDEEAPEMATPYTNSKAGQKKFGGWNEAGIRKYVEHQANIKGNRVDEVEFVKAVEEAALERIRKVEKLEEKEAKRKTKKRKPSEPGAFDDETDDENDFSSW